jgi:hypothetical protein
MLNTVTYIYYGINHNKLIFAMDLAGDSNKNEKYETAYIWLLYYNASRINRISTPNDE